MKRPLQSLLLKTRLLKTRLLKTRLLKTWLLPASLLLTSACEQPPTQPAKPLAPQQFRTFGGMPSLPQGPIAGHPWATEPCQPGQLGPDELACVAHPDPHGQPGQQGVAVTRARFEAVRSSYPPGTPGKDIVRALVDEELLARAAAEKGLWSQWLAPQQRQAMAARLLVKTQEEALTPAQIADRDIQTAYKNPQIKLHYDHAAAYFVTDVQLLCCKGDWRQCEKREEVRDCIEKTQPQAQALYRILTAQTPSTALELKARVAALGGQFSLAAVADVEFWYDKTKPYDQQKGYDLMVKEFAVPVVEMQPGDLGVPIRTPFGWHIPRLNKIDPAIHKPWNDPAVRQDIAVHILNAVREREVQHYLATLLAKSGAQFFYDRLELKF